MANFKSAAAATRISFARAALARDSVSIKMSNSVRRLNIFVLQWSGVIPSSDTQNHHFGGLNQRGRSLSRLQPHLLGGICRDNGSDVLLADGHRHPRQQAAVFDG